MINTWYLLPGIFSPHLLEYILRLSLAPGKITTAKKIERNTALDAFTRSPMMCDLLCVPGMALQQYQVPGTRYDRGCRL